MASIDLTGDVGGGSGYWNPPPMQPLPGPRSDSGGSLNLTPGYTPPAPSAKANMGIPNVPRPSVDPSVVYTDPQGNGYDAPALAAAWQAGSLGAGADRVPDILAPYGLGPKAQAAGGAAGGGASGGASTFSDPASQQWEAILNQRISQLQTPYQNPGFDTAVNQLNSYLTRLNGPAYTPEQMSLIQ